MGKDTKHTPKVKEQRNLFVDIHSESKQKVNKGFCTNQIKTAKYNIFTFLPLGIFYQFHTAFNFFFLFQTILLSIPSISTLEPFTSIMPFVVILIINLIREGLEDLRKHFYDNECNNSKTETYKEDSFMETKWADTKIGEIIKVKKNETIPADILVIKSSSRNGLCYLETSNLDGENALKPREALSVTHSNIKEDSAIASLLECSKVEVDPPSMDIYFIEGTAFISGQQNTYFDIKNILLRGGKLKNVDYVYGIVIYTGKDTKLMKNINHSSLKFSLIDRKTDIIVIYILIICLLICTICTVVGSLFRSNNMPDYHSNMLKADYMLYYVTEESDSVLEIVRIFTGQFITFCTLIPISIVILLAVVKALQSVVLELFEPALRLGPDDKVKCLSTTLIEEMGMVKYIFTDKTGTLTQNIMEFKACSIFTLLFDDDEEKDEQDEDDRFSRKFSKGRTKTTNVSSSKFSKTFDKDKIFDDIHRNIPLLIKEIKGCPFESQNEAIKEFFFNLSLNHDVLSEYDSEKKENVFQGANPDEVTLVTAAAEMGFTFVERHDKTITLSIKNSYEEEIVKSFELLQKFDFTSARQRSSIIVRDLSTQEIKLYLKGSDTKVFESVDSFSSINILPKSKEHVDSFAKRGLRTLCYSFKIIDESTYTEWERNYMDIKYKAINDKSLNAELEKSITEMESHATLLGASALEDKLQDDVKTDLQRFIEADINVWMITGDKMDTAESIGHSCKLFNDDTEVFKIRASTDVGLVIERMKEIRGGMKILEDELKEISKAADEGNIIINKKQEDKPQGKDHNISPHNDNLNNNHEKSPKQNKNMMNSENLDNKSQKIKSSRSTTKNNNKCLSVSISEQNRQSAHLSEFMDVNGAFAEMETMRNNDIKLVIGENKIISAERKKGNADFIEKIPNQCKEIGKEAELNNANQPPQGNHPTERLPLCKTFTVETNQNDPKAIKDFIPNIPNSNEPVHDASIMKFMADKQCFDNSDVKYDNMTILRGKVKNASISNVNDNSNRDNLPSEANDNQKKEQPESKGNPSIPISERKFNEYYNFCRKQLILIKQAQQQLFHLSSSKVNDALKIEMNFGLVIEGSSISSCITPGEAGNLFWELIQKSKSLICCRCSPIQKAQVVQFVKNRTDKITLAIGDGGNDVNMIKTAHVGIGLFGKEGYQAAYNSDYAISQFKYLKRLLFVVGRFTLERNSYFIYCYFFKNIVYTIPQLWLCLFSGFSGTNLYDEWLYSGFNTYCSILPVAARAITEEDFDPDESSNLNQRQVIKYLFPNIYKEYRDRIPFNLVRFFGVFVSGIVFSVPVYFIPAFFMNNTMDYLGNSISYWDISFCCFLINIIHHFLMVCYDTLFWNWFVLLLYGAQVLINLLFFVIYEACDYGTEVSGIMYPIMDNALFWFTLIIASAICILPYLIYSRALFFFGGHIVNKIKQKKTDKLCVEKYYRKKLEQMTRATRSVAKFKKIYRVDKRVDYDNIADQQMKKIVDEFKERRKKSKLNKKGKISYDKI